MNTSSELSYLKFLKSESASGIILVFSAILAMILANSPLKWLYDMILETPVEIRIGGLEIAKPLLLWINDGLMAIFFFLVGLELKREVVEGELSNKRNIILPGFGALGGMLIPALFYIFFNHGNAVAMQGWAIPTATDIAFALGVLSLLGDRVPLSLKIFLTSLAIFDDFGAIIIIALFYTAQISAISLVIAIICIVLLFWVNKKDPDSKSVYLLIGIVMWAALLKSGVHATLAGVILALFIPLKSKNADDISPLKTLEQDLHGVVGFFILPLFAFANAGITLSGVDSQQLSHPVPLGIALGLFVGKQLGVFVFCWLAIKLKLAQLPASSNWLSLYGVSVLCGIGFTMSLFIGSLAFEETEVNLLFDDRLGILIGSLLSGVLGYFLLRKATRTAS